MSSSRRPSNAESGTMFRRPPDSFLDDSKDRERDRDQEFRSDSSFYRRDYAQSRDRTRTFDHDKTSRSHSLGGHTEPGYERPRMSSRQSMQDHRLHATQSPSDSSERNSRQSSPKTNSGSRPISPKGDSAQPGNATKETTTSTILPFKPPAVGGVVEESAASSKPDSPDKVVVKDPRLRRINTKMKLNSETAAASPSVASSQPQTFAADRSAPNADQTVIRKGRWLDSTTDPSNTQSFSPSTPDAPFTGPGDFMTTVSALSRATLQKGSADDADQTMTDMDVVSTIVPSTTRDSITSTQPPQTSATASNLMESFVQLMTGFADQVSSTSILKYKRDIAKQKYWRCKQNDERNRKNFKDYPVTIEQGRQARQLAEQEFASVDQKLKEHVQAQNESAQTVAGLLVSQIEQQKIAQRAHPEQDKMFQQTLDKVEELSAHVKTTLAEIKQAKQSAAKSVKDAYELVDRATSTCKEAQQAAQKTFTQVNELTLRVNENSRNTATLYRDVAEDQAQIRKVMGLTEHLEEDVKSLRKRMANTEDDVKCLWDDKAQSTVLESMRKDVNKDVTHFKETQRELAGQVWSLEETLKKCLQSYQILAPKVERHSKQFEELNTATETSGGNDPKGIYGVEAANSNVVPYERLESLTLDLHSEFKELQRSFQDLTLKVQSSATQFELISLRNSIASLKIEVENINVTGLQKELEAYHRDTEADREDLKELTKEVDELHTGQEQIRDTFTAHNDDIATRVEKAEKDILEVSVELRKTYDKAKEESENMAKQVNGISKRVEATMPAPAARPTPPSAPPTPQMHQTAHLPGRGSSPPIIENGVAITRLNEVNRNLMNLTGYINGQFTNSPNLPARLGSLEHALMNLQGRYNNLTTEPVVRAMVQQMQLMYPYASTAQNEIRVVRAAVSELEKLPPKIEMLTTRVDQNAKDIERADLKIADQEKERVSSDIKRERLVEHVKEERDNLKRHVQEQHERLTQHVEERYGQLDRSIAAVVEDSVSGMAEVATKITNLKQVAELWNTANRAERKSQRSEKGVTPKAVTQLQVNGPTVSHFSPDNHWASTQTPTGTPEESEREALQLLKKFDASASSRRVSAYSRRVVPKSTVSDTDDSDAPLAASRTNSSKSIAVASPNQETSAVSVKRKRAHNASNHGEERTILSEIPISPSKRKVARRS